MSLCRCPLFNHIIIWIISTYTKLLSWSCRIHIPIPSVYCRIICSDSRAIFFIPIDSFLVAFSIDFIKSSSLRFPYSIHSVYRIFQCVQTSHLISFKGILKREIIRIIHIDFFGCVSRLTCNQYNTKRGFSSINRRSCGIF
ncbi:hypothetical protein D3C87_1540630 [compost metagenome]